MKITVLFLPYKKNDSIKITKTCIRLLAKVSHKTSHSRAVKFSKKPPFNLEGGADYMVFVLFEGIGGKATG